MIEVGKSGLSTNVHDRNLKSQLYDWLKGRCPRQIVLTMLDFLIVPLSA